MTGRAAEFYGSNDVDRLFPGGSPTTSVPWSQVRPTRTHRVSNPEMVHDAIVNPDRYRTMSLDPRELHATQPGLQRAAVAHYMGPDYHRTGQTFADQHQAGNQTPVVFHNLDNDHLSIQSGHHRAASALLRGDQFDALVVAGHPSTHKDAAAFQRRVIDDARARHEAARIADMKARGLA